MAAATRPSGKPGIDYLCHTMWSVQCGTDRILSDGWRQPANNLPGGRVYEPNNASQDEKPQAVAAQLGCWEQLLARVMLV